MLDSTGPSATKHYLVLRAIGWDRLQRMQEIHGFSGGALAYFGFHAVQHEALAMPIADFFGSFDRIFRSCHHADRLSPLKAIHKLAIQRTSAFEREALAQVIESIFSRDYLDQDLSSIAANFTPYVGVKGQKELAHGCRVLPAGSRVRDLLMAACCVPAFYGKPSNIAPYFDAAFASGYKPKLSSLTRSSESTLVSTPWRSGLNQNTLFVNCFGHSYQKAAMFLDFGLLLFNVPNRTYEHDLVAAFAP
ncbi:MAG TPA: hypothetical protein VE954_07245 [Oligoflexus sp.]|uniref:hypothetical protein n=1 Tax=Oligoflexus sp. TaxID=1971216 RepID=UPI002D5E4B2F|nr:hypothetical protein [Oligoflexus sp.]HYX32893.1 hypothetical protein [Oligoflexus sp.]